MIIEFDPVKREKTLLERGLDFADADKIFAGLHFIARDDRCDYGEERFITSDYWMTEPWWWSGLRETMPAE